ncbi:MAG TPA: phosphoribosyltransferase [Pyrinomonadaceae bacterium]|nr:phosphoribosyltransferase [Pyrinomonadaceae bacterium]
MISTNLNAIWGTPLTMLPDWPSGAQLRRPPNVPIARQLHTFLQDQINEWSPDIIVVIERKGTAILRALKEWNQDSFSWPWSKVFSSDIIDQVPPELLEGKKILIFDDTMNTGCHLRDLLDQLARRGLAKDGNFRVAVFAMHEVSSSGFWYEGNLVPHAWFYRGLTRTSYEAIRRQIVSMLQEAGSLMLDTEHLEVRIRLNGSFSNFVEALQRNSHAVVFRSSQGRTNITVLYGQDEGHSLPLDMFPPDTSCVDIVKKCRIVQRDPNEYAIIPICFPSVSAGMEPWAISPANRELLGNNSRADYKTRFYDVGLLAALEVLRWVLKDLAIWGNDNYTLSLPLECEEETLERGYVLHHLHAMYPTLNIAALSARIAEVARRAEIEGNQMRGFKFESHRTPLYTDVELRRNAISLLGVIRHVLDQQTAAKGWSENWKSLEWDGMSLTEIFNLGKNAGWTDECISTLFDILIDEATLSTDIKESPGADGIKRIVRMFSPAGEVVSDLVRRYTTQWGLPYAV